MIPVTTIGGYLGAGKTTLVNHLLRVANGRRLAVLVNEFGALPIDEDLIEAQDDSLISIAGGCICCSFGDNLTGALLDLTTLDPKPDHILIEASGVAIPGAIAASLSLMQGLAHDGTIVLADAEAVQDLAANRYIGDTITRQLRDADLVVLTKTDLIGPNRAAPVSEWVRAHAPQAKLTVANHGKVPLEALLGHGGEPIASPLGHADADYHSVTLTPQSPIDGSSLGAALAQDRGVLRAKGFLPTPDGPKLLQVVGGRFDLLPAGKDATIGLVCIGLAGHLDIAALTRLSNSETPAL